MKLMNSSASNIVLALALFGIISGPLLLAPDAAAQKVGSLSKTQKAQFQREKVALRTAKTAAKRAITRVNTQLPKAKRDYDSASRQMTNSTRNLSELSRKLDNAKAADRVANTGPSGLYTPSPNIARQQALFDRAKAFHDNGPARRFNTEQTSYNGLTAQLATSQTSLANARTGITTRKENKDAARAANLATAEAAKAQRRAAKAARNQQAGAIAQQVFPPIPAGIVPGGFGPAGQGNGIYVSLPAAAITKNGLPPPPPPLASYDNAFSQLQ